MPQPAPSRLVAYLRTFQAAQACTALADVAMGFVFVHSVAEVPLQWPSLALLLVAGALLYCGGAILGRLYGNKPSVPGGKKRKRDAAASASDPISTAMAMRLGFLFLFNGVMLAAAAGYMHAGDHGPPWRSGIVAALLAAVLIAYNVRLKSTPLAPFLRGLARLLMVLLGMSAAGLPAGEASFAGFHASCYLAAGGLALYEVGVAWFERASLSSAPQQLLLPLIPMVLGVALLGSLPLLSHPGKPAAAMPLVGYIFFGLMFLPLARRMQGFAKHSEPVERLSLLQYLTASVIVFDAVITVITSGPLPGILIAALLLPNFALARLSAEPGRSTA